MVALLFLREVVRVYVCWDYAVDAVDVNDVAVVAVVSLHHRHRRG